jgi:hypothetical protein
MSAAERFAALPEGLPAPPDDRLAALRSHIARLVPAPAVAPAVLATGLPALDRALAAGGLTRGAITTLVGAAGAGTTTVWRAMVSATLATGARVAVVDATRTVAPRDFASLVGGSVPRESLVFVRPPTPATAAWCADLLVRSGAFPLVVLDGAPALGRGVMGRLAQLAREADTALLVTGDDDGATRLGGVVRVRVECRERGTVALHIEKGSTRPRPVSLSLALPIVRRLGLHDESPDRRGVAAAPTVRRGRRAAEPPREARRPGPVHSWQGKA